MVQKGHMRGILMPEFLHGDHVNPVRHVVRECAHIRPSALCCATGFLKSINQKVLSPQCTRGGGRKEAKSCANVLIFAPALSAAPQVFWNQSIIRSFHHSRSHKEAKSIVITYWLFIDFSLACLAYGFLYLSHRFILFWQLQTFDWKSIDLIYMYACRIMASLTSQLKWSKFSFLLFLTQLELILVLFF